jgi:ATP-dependent Lhr-like helicase
MDVYARLAPWIQDYIYRSGWQELRPVQVAAAEVLFGSDDHLLLSTGTASGKTEAAFLPALTLLGENPADSVGILYISPLKALINDQFTRLRGLLEEGRVPVCKWHGDASAGAKARLLRQPEGVLQITPESLESLLTRRCEAPALFGQLRFVIIDEVHYFMASERGIQLQCLLERLERAAGCAPRRIGLSATLGEPEAARRWLIGNTQRSYAHPQPAEAKRRLRIYMDLFDGTEQAQEEDGESTLTQALYGRSLGKKTILFTKSRLEAEQTIAGLRRLAAQRHTPDVYRVHHGSISAALREEAEYQMKHSEQPMVTGATVTLELGLDIGDLEQVIQLGAPVSASSLTQRIGRCGRKGQAAELFFAVEEEPAQPEDPLGGFHWELLKAIAVLQLYLEERWVEPSQSSRLPYGLLYHQTMCALLACGGERTAQQLARDVLTLAPFRAIPQEDYRLLLLHLLEIGHLQRSETGGLLIGYTAEPIVTGYEFLSVFAVPEEFRVLHKGEAIGTVSEAPRPGERIGLAGHTWQVLRCDEAKKTISVTPVKGAAETKWESFYIGQMHGHVLQKMREILRGEDTPPYLSPACRAALAEARATSRALGVTEQWLLPLGEAACAVFPWLGTPQLQALRLALKQKGIAADICPGSFTPVCLLAETDAAAMRRALAAIRRDGIATESLPVNERLLPKGKFDAFLPKALLQKKARAEAVEGGFAVDA